MKPYSSARDEYEGTEGIFLDANENPLGSVSNKPYNRYPDPYQKDLKLKIASLKRVNQNQVFLGNGSDEAIDLLIRAVCSPGKDNIIILPPTYGMYQVSASLNDIEVIEAPLTADFMIDTGIVLKSITPATKIIFICTPNNPTGNALKKADIVKIITSFDGLVVVDEAYIDFAQDIGLVSDLNNYPNLVVMQTFSKAWGMASLRLGAAYASEEIIAVLNKVKPPYNINGATQDLALKALDNVLLKESMVEKILDQREFLAAKLKDFEIVVKVYPSQANFLLVKFRKGLNIYDFLVSHKIITRDRSKVAHCDDSIRITVGTEEENLALISTLASYKL